ncbi:ribokinase [Clostridia bacterium]|nr:ribokinase [Clostridia bacterium]
MSKIFVLGSLNYDLVIRCDRMPEQGETLAGYGFMGNCGGKGANQAAAAAKAGGEVYMVGCVGGDVYGQMQRAALTEYGVRTDFVETVSGLTGIAVIVVAEGDNRILLDAGANAKVAAPLVDRALQSARPGDYLVVQFEIPDESNIYALQAAKRLGMTTVVNPAPARPVRPELLHATDYFIPNENELLNVAGRRTEAEAVRELFAKGCQKIVVTLGAKGAACYDGATRVEAPARKVKAVDTTAAGDTFIGYFTASLAAGKSAAEALKAANAAASLTVQSAGAAQSIPYYRDVAPYLL